MTDDLLFVTRIAAAFGQTDIRSALRDAFEEIERLGVAKRRGHATFHQFMAVVRRANDDLGQMEGEVRTIMFSLLSADRGLARRAMRLALQLIGSRSNWRSEYQQLRETMRAMDRHPAAEFVVASDGRPIGSISLASVSGYGHVGGIAPGQYALTVFGRVLWEGELSEHDLIWATAFPDQPLPLAAATELGRALATREFELLGGELIMRICPGLESGHIELETHLPRSGT